MQERNLPRERIVCDRKATADAIRAEWPDALVPEDDGRKMTVVVSGDALDEWINSMRLMADEDEVETFGQEPLTDSEKARLDFGRTNVFHARSCKAIALAMGVEDWLARYDHRLTVDEHREVYRRAVARPSEMTMREFPNRQFRCGPSMSGGVAA